MSWFSYVEDRLVPEQGCKPWASALDDGNAIMGHNSSDISDCEVMMMVGLPASGKTTWAEKWTEEYPEKRFVLLGRNLILDEMKGSVMVSFLVELVQVLYQEITVDLLIKMCMCPWSSGSISGGRAESCQNYGFVDPYGRSNTVDLFRRILIAWTIEEAGLPSELQPNRANSNLLLAVCGYLDAILCFLPCLPCGTPRIPLPASLAPSPRSPYSNFPAGMQQHSGGYNPPPQRNY
ncbi:hypothetical protein NC653_010442 [Populus alba x Populus x berolinensis]|uniref:Uncharacterized protein n=1 Tax=Populus alba x Populus x berolinensis TaxID=444605 RepID=A0AAD6QZR8_9ROSI|nr:hypothetical protein NC653_010442 [Populus alba x Populus x berolinensis]